MTITTDNAWFSSLDNAGHYIFLYLQQRNVIPWQYSDGVTHELVASNMLSVFCLKLTPDPTAFIERWQELYTIKRTMTTVMDQLKEIGNDTGSA